jgi:hypothetical protein
MTLNDYRLLVRANKLVVIEFGIILESMGWSLAPLISCSDTVERPFPVSDKNRLKITIKTFFILF